MSTPSITQQVIKYCDMGFFPICKLTNNAYIIFTPFKDDYDKMLCSYGCTIDEAKSIIACHTFGPEGNTPTEIIGFYRHGFKPFEVGDKVVCINDNDKLGIIKEINPDATYEVSFSPIMSMSPYHHCELEPYLESSPAERKHLEVTLEDIANKFGVEKISIISNN